MKNNIYHIQERFPEKKDSIDLLMEQDTKFLTLCEDYDACVDALQYWAESEKPEAKIRVAEYRMLVQELQGEIIEDLEAAKPRRMD